MSDDLPFGEAFAALRKRALDPRSKNKLRVDPRDSAQIYDALASDELDDHTREELIRYLIDFFIDKQHYKLDTVGFVTG